MIIAGYGLLVQLREKGLIPRTTRRVVIDIPVDGLATMYVETVATEDILTALPADLVTVIAKTKNYRSIDDQ